MDQLNFNAIYGDFDRNFEPQDVSDVTDIIISDFLLGARIVIPAESDLDSIFQHSSKGERKFLQIQCPGRTFNIPKDNYEFDTAINLADHEKDIKLVYYVFINRKSNWKEIISGQLKQLKSYGILDEAELYIHITDPSNIFVDVIRTIKEICKNAVISGSHINQFEYPAIKMLYELAINHPSAVFIYLHTKGMSYNIPSRLMLEAALLKGTFKNWRKNIEAFKNEKISKLGLFPAKEDPIVQKDFRTKGGWMWYNFWYAKGSYIANSCEAPKVTTNRYYYEVWLGGPLHEGLIPVNDCFNLYPKQNDNYFNGDEVQMSLPELISSLT